MKLFKLGCLLFIGTQSPVWSQPITCRGGDGPTPLTNISSDLPSTASLLPLVGEAQEFVVWPKSKSIVYRNNYRELRRFSYKKNKDYHLARLAMPMSKVVDPSEKYVLADRSNWYLNAEQNSPSWDKFNTSLSSKPLFWHTPFLGTSHLYSLSRFYYPYSEKIQTLEVLKFTAGQVKPETCQLSSNVQGDFYIGEGHVFPNIFIYQLRPTARGNILSLYRIRIGHVNKSCVLEPVKTYSEPVAGQLVSVHQFADGVTFAYVTWTTKGYQLHWDSPSSKTKVCEFGDRPPLVLNEEHAVVAGWNQASGLTALLPNSNEFANILPDKTREEVRLKDLFLSKKGETLYLNLTNSAGERKLHALKLDDRLSN